MPCGAYRSFGIRAVTSDVCSRLSAPAAVVMALIIATAALDAQIATDLAAADVAEHAAPDEADRTGDKPACHSAHGRVCRPARGMGGRRRGNDRDGNERESTKRFHRDGPP